MENESKNHRCTSCPTCGSNRTALIFGSGIIILALILTAIAPTVIQEHGLMPKMMQKSPVEQGVSVGQVYSKDMNQSGVPASTEIKSEIPVAEPQPQ